MYALKPPAVYVFDEVARERRSRERTERMLAALGIGGSAVRRVSDADIPEMIRANGWEDARLRQGARGGRRDPALVSGGWPRSTLPRPTPFSPRARRGPRRGSSAS